MGNKFTVFKSAFVAGIVFILLNGFSQEAERIQDYGALRAEAEQAYASGSFVTARDLYREAEALDVSSDERAWIRYRIADCTLRSVATARQVDPSVADDALESLESIVDSTQSSGELARVWAEANETLGDYYGAAMGYSRDRTRSFRYYSDALQYWARSPNSEEGKGRYLQIVDKLVGRGDYYYFNAEDEIFGEFERILKNAISLTDAPDARSRARLRLAEFYASNSNEEKRLEAMGVYESLIEEESEDAWYAGALFAYAEYLSQSGFPVRDGEGGWNYERDYVRAVSLYQRIVDSYEPGVVAEHRIAERRLEQIKSPQLSVNASRQFYKEERPSYDIQWRNLEAIQFELRRVDPVDDIDPQASAQFSAYDLTSSIEDIDGEVTHRWRWSTQDEGRHEPGYENQMALPVEVGVGAYILKATSEGLTARTLLWKTDVIAILTSSEKGSSVWVADAMSGAPRKGAKVRLWVGHRNNNAMRWNSFDQTTDEDGIAAFESDWTESRMVFAVVVSEGAGAATSTTGFNGGRESSGWRFLAVSDRSAYRPGDIVKWRMTVRRELDGEYTSVENRRMRVEALGADGMTVYEKELDLNKFGTIWGEFETEAEWALGEYQLRVHDVDNEGRMVGSRSLFRLEEYRKPDFEVEVEPVVADSDGRVYRPGESIEMRIQARYYSGEPAVDAEVEVILSRRPFQFVFSRFPMPMEMAIYPPRYDTTPEELQEWTVRTDSEGNARIEFDAEWSGDEDAQEYIVDATVTDLSRRAVSGQSSVRVTRRPYVVGMTTDGVLFEPGDDVEVEIAAMDANDTPFPAEGVLTMNRLTSQTVWTRANGQERDHESVLRLRESGVVFPPVDEEWTREERVSETVVYTEEVVLGGSGKASVSHPLEEKGAYRIRWTPSDYEWKEGDLSVTDVWVADGAVDRLGYHRGAVELVIDREQVDSGGLLPVMIVTDQPGRFVWLHEETGDRIESRFERLDGTARFINLPIEDRHAPNFQLHVIMVGDLRVYSDSKEVKSAHANRRLHIEPVELPSSERPGASTQLEYRITDQRGEPVEAELGVRVYDRSLEAIFAPETVNPFEIFYGHTRPRRFYPVTSVSGRPFASEVGDGGAGIPTPRTLSRMGRGNMLGDVAAPAALEMSVAGQSAKKSGPPHDVGVRTDFRDTALWVPSVVCSEDGIVTIDFEYPESLTSWKLQAWGVTDAAAVGFSEAQVETNMPLMVRLQHPRFLIEGDQVTISATVSNQSGEDQQVSVDWSVEGAKLIESSEKTSIHVPSGDSVRLDRRLEANSVGSVQIEAIARTPSESDGARGEFQVRRSAVPLQVTRAGKILSTEAFGAMPFELPERLDETTLDFEVAVTPTMAGSLVAAIPYLVDYPYGCVEQTMSRFLPAVISTETLRTVGVPPAEVESLLGESLTLIHEGKRDDEPREPLEELSDMVDAGMARIAKMQNRDGGWGWWPEGSSDPYMTAYVVWGLRLARTADLEVPEGAIPAGVAFLLQRVVDVLERPDDAAWILHALAGADMRSSDRKLFDRAMAGVWERRLRLSAYGRALLAIATRNEGQLDRAELLTKNLENGVWVDDGTSGLNGGNGNALRTARWGAAPGWTRWMDSPVESTAFAVMALLKNAPESPLLEPAVAWLMENRRGSRWNNTRDTSIALIALNAYLKKTGELDEGGAFSVFVNQRELGDVEFEAGQVLSGGARFKIPADWLRPGANQVVVRKNESGFPLYYSLDGSLVTSGRVDRPEGNGLSIRRHYYRIDKEATLLEGLSTTRTELRDGDPVESGARIEAVLVLKAKNDWSYLVFEDPKPAGFEPLKLRSDSRFEIAKISERDIDNVDREPVDRQFVRQELRDDRTAFFADRLAQGYWEIRYEMIAEAPGAFTAPPAHGAAMYTPAIHCNGIHGTIVIEDRDGL